MSGKTPRNLQQVLNRYTSRKLKKSWPLLYQGEVPRTAFILKSGVVKVYDINSSGEEKVVTFCKEGDLIPAEWVFGKSPVSLYYHEAFTDAEVYNVPRDVIKDVIESDAEMLRYALDQYVTLYVGTTMHIYALEQTKATDKLLRILQYLTIRFGENAATNLERISLRLTHQDLARMIGMTRETTAVELGKLKKRGVVSYQGQRYLVNTKKMLQILGEDEFSSVKL